MVTELERIAMRLQCGNAGKETPRNPFAMVRFGNHNRIRDASLIGSRFGATAKGKKVLRAILHNARKRKVISGIRTPIYSCPVSAAVRSQDGQAHVRPPV